MPKLPHFRRMLLALCAVLILVAAFSLVRSVSTCPGTIKEDPKLLWNGSVASGKTIYVPFSGPMSVGDYRSAALIGIPPTSQIEDLDQYRTWNPGTGSYNDWVTEADLWHCNSHWTFKDNETQAELDEDQIIDEPCSLDVAFHWVDDDMPDIGGYDPPKEDHLTLNIFKVNVVIGGADEVVNNVKQLRAYLPKGADGQGKTYSAAASLIHGPPVIDYSWTTGGLWIHPELSTSKSGASLTSIDVVGAGPGGGSATCSIRYHPCSGDANSTATTSGADSANVYRATLTLLSEKATIGHAWYELTLDPGNATAIQLVGIVPSSYLGSWGFFAVHGLPIDEGVLTTPGSGQHTATGQHAWGISLDDLVSGLAWTAGIEDAPPTYLLDLYNCVDVAVELGETVGVETIDSAGIDTPSEFSDYLNGLEE